MDALSPGVERPALQWVMPSRAVVREFLFNKGMIERYHPDPETCERRISTLSYFVRTMEES